MKEPAFAQSQEKFISERFEACDADDKGFLSEPQFKKFYISLKKDSAKRGNYVDTRTELISQAYSLAS